MLRIYNTHFLFTGHGYARAIFEWINELLCMNSKSKENPK